MPRVKTFDQELALNKALELFWEKGYEATSLSDLTAKLNIGKGSFYDTFGSKRALFDKCLSNYQSQGFVTLDALMDSNSDPVEIIKDLLSVHTEIMLGDETPNGCFIANSTAELADDTGVQEFLSGHNKIMRVKLEGLFANSKYKHQSGKLADLVLTHLTGISVLSKLIKDPERFESSNEMFLRVFN